MCDSGKRESFYEGSNKEQSARKISRFARNDGMGYSAVCVIAENGNPSTKEARKSGVRGRFLDYARNDGGGIEKSKKRRMAASGFICFFLPRLRKPIRR